MTAAAKERVPVEHHMCLTMSCTRCGETYNDDTNVHFGCLNDAIKELATEGWAFTAESLLCATCIDKDEGDVVREPAVVELCEYCWPPMFSDGTQPDHCLCDEGRAPARVLPPVINGQHPAIAQRQCITITCPDCGSGVAAEDDERGEPHYMSIEAALADVGADYEWIVSDVVICCRRCASRRECAATEHDFPDQPQMIREDLEYRWCRNCHSPLTMPVINPEMPWP
ncbi:hypothetical protein [Mycolicibacterium llatzerense]|uniref:hypothetical protein n=1 Tax=Mycolicibacterium llatzerense TaxID=280871 RepID=UPI0008DE309B|nr:hypothetical protein [Mycolicibacterium llatzerense]